MSIADELFLPDFYICPFDSVPLQHSGTQLLNPYVIEADSREQLVHHIVWCASRVHLLHLRDDLVASNHAFLIRIFREPVRTLHGKLKIELAIIAIPRDRLGPSFPGMYRRCGHPAITVPK